jgi:CubicO group peptidase (beta-lactamase class C family)
MIAASANGTARPPISRILTLGTTAMCMVVTSLGAQTPRVGEAHASDNYRSAIESVRSLIREAMVAENIPGASFAVAIADDLVWSEGFGLADLEHRTPVTTLTRFRIGSVSKTMTATGLGILIERGQIDLDVPVQQYVPDFPTKRWPISTRQVGGHIAGVRHYRGQEMRSSVHYPTVSSGLTIFANDTLLFEPGTSYSYSSYGWNLVSAVMEGASGQDFLAFMRDEVWEPLGLRHTLADHNDSIIPDRTEFYEHGSDGAIVNAPYVDNSYKWAGGGFLSTPEDLVRFGAAHLRPGYLRAETLHQLMEPQSLRNGESTGYGIGWSTGTQDDGDTTKSHSGGSVGGTTLLLLIPAHQLVVAGVVNISGYAPAMTRRVAQAFEDYMRRETR